MTTHIHTPSAVDLPRISRHVGWFGFGNLVDRRSVFADNRGG